MYDPDYYDFDEDGNPEFHGHGPPKEEPDCGACCDRQVVWGRWRRSRPCPGCNPTRLDRIRYAMYWRIRTLAHGRKFTDEAPF